MGHFCRGVIGFELRTVFCGECLEMRSELTGASEVGIFVDVPTDLPPLSENKVFTFQVNIFKF